MHLVWSQERSQMTRSQPLLASTTDTGCHARPDSTTTTMDGRPVKTATGSTYRCGFCLESWSSWNKVGFMNAFTQAYYFIVWKVCWDSIFKCSNINDSLKGKFTLLKLKKDCNPVLTRHTITLPQIYLCQCACMRGRERVGEWEV